MKNTAYILSLIAALCIGTACAKENPLTPENPAATTAGEELFSYQRML